MVGILNDIRMGMWPCFMMGSAIGGGFQTIEVSSGYKGLDFSIIALSGQHPGKFQMGLR